MRRDGRSDGGRSDGGRKGGVRAIPALLAAAGLASAVPIAGAAAAGGLIPPNTAFRSGYVPFTPARIDPALARRVAATLGLDGLRFTPAPRSTHGDRIVTMAVRLDQATARAITVRRTLADASVGAGAGAGGALTALPPFELARYNLGAARGFQKFGAPAAKSLALPDPSRSSKPCNSSKPPASKILVALNC